MYLWHNHQRTLWFERLHSEKPTNLQRNEPEYVGSGLPRLYDPAWVHVKKMTKSCQNVYGSDLSPTLTLVTAAATLSLVE